MVLGTNRPRAIGERRVGCYDAFGEWHDQPFVIVRHATRNEWIDWLRSCGNYDPRASECQTPYFYAVATD